MIEESREARIDAMRALEVQFEALTLQIRRLLAANAHHIDPTLVPGAYKVFTSIVRFAPVTVSALAEHLVLDKGQVSRMVRDLEERGLVQRTPAPDDARSTLLSPTAEGEARLAEARSARPGNYLSTLESWSIEELQTFARMLQALSEGERP